MVGKLQFVLMTLLLNATALTATAQEKATEQPSVPPTSAGAPTEQPAPAPAMTTPASSAAAEPAAPQWTQSIPSGALSVSSSRFFWTADIANCRSDPIMSAKIYPPAAWS